MSNVYYNWVYTNNTTQAQLLSLNDIRSSPIINDMQNYEVAVIKFTIPTGSIPIIQSFPTGADAVSQTTGFSITMTGTGGTTSQQFLTYVPIKAAGTQIYSYGTLMDMINVAFLNAATAIGATAGGEYPFITFSSSSQLFSIYFPTVYVTGGVSIWFNSNLYGMFPSFPFIYFNSRATSYITTGQYAKFNYGNANAPDKTELTGYEQIIQEYPSTISLYQPRSLRFISGNLPTRPESIPIAGSAASNVSGGSNNNNQVILTDFDLPLANSIADIKPFVQYYQVGPYRYIDLMTQGALYQMDVSIYYVDAQSNLYPLYIDPNQTATIKFMFKKKNC